MFENNLTSNKVTQLETAAQAMATRLTVLEGNMATVKDSHNGHEESQAKSFNDIQKILKEVVQHIEESRRDTKDCMTEMKMEIISRMGREYMPSLQVREEMTSLRKSVLADIIKESKRATHQFWLIWAGMSTGLAMSAWIYMNMVSTG